MVRMDAMKALREFVAEDPWGFAFVVLGAAIAVLFILWNGNF